MSLVGNALNNWLQRQGASVMRQEVTINNPVPIKWIGTAMEPGTPEWLKEVGKGKFKVVSTHKWQAEAETAYMELKAKGLKPTLYAVTNTWTTYYVTIPTHSNPGEEATVCEAFPPHTKEAMIDIALKSADKLREMGCPITGDYTLGKVLTGTRTRVPIPRPAGTIGTYHTHPFGWARPSTYDLLEGLSRDDKVSCIGASGKIGTKIACFTPKEPRWSEFKDKLTDLFNNVREFNKKISGKYKERGIKLQRLLKEVRPEYHEEGIMLERRRRELIDALDRQLLYMGYKEEWRPQRHINGWEAEPIMMDSCRIIWEALPEELPYEY